MREILVADDEKCVRDVMKALLEREGFKVRLAVSARDALAKFSEARPHLVILDVIMPGGGGFFACSEMRKIDRTVPILFLTSAPCEAAEVTGLNLGADDFLGKDASDLAILARIRRALERAALINEAGGPSSESDTMSLGPALIDFKSRTVSLEGKLGAHLTANDIAILRSLASRRPNYMTCDDIAKAMHGEATQMSASSIRVQILRLKRKLGRAGGMISNERGDGYRLLP